MQLEAGVLAQLLHTCVAAGAWDLALQLCSAALVAQARGEWTLCDVGSTAKQARKPAVQNCGPRLITHCSPCCLAPSRMQGATAAPLFNHVLQAAAAARQFGAVVQALAAMRAAGLEVDPAVAAQVGRARWMPWPCRAASRLGRQVAAAWRQARSPRRAHAWRS